MASLWMEPIRKIEAYGFKLTYDEIRSIILAPGEFREFRNGMIHREDIDQQFAARIMNILYELHRQVHSLLEELNL